MMREAMNSTPLERPRSRAETKQITRQALLRAGLAEVVERGLDGPSLDGICARAGYTRGAFYVHFKDRDDFTISLMDWALGSALDTLIGTADSEPLEDAMRRLANAVSTGTWPLGDGSLLPTEPIAAAFERYAPLRDRAAVLLNRAQLRLTKLAMHGQESIEIRRDVSASQIAQMVITMASGTITLRRAGVPIDARRLQADLLTLLGRSVG